MRSRRAVQTCSRILKSEMERVPGIESFQLDPEEANLIVRYDQKTVSPDDIQDVTARLRPALELNLAGCPAVQGPDRGQWCRSCIEIAEKYRAEFEARAGAVHGLISVGSDGRDGQVPPATVGEIQVRLDVPKPGVGAPAVERLRELWPRVRDLPWEALLTAATFVLMFSALGAETLLDMPGLATGLYIAAYLSGGVFGVKAGVSSLLSGEIDIDLLMVLAAIGAAIVGAPFEGVLLLFLFSLSNVLQDFAMGRTRNAIRALMQLRPARASVLREGEEVILPVESCRVGDIFVVRPGEKIALDGVVVDGQSAVDQAVITGESVPVRKAEGDTVLAGTMNKNGVLRVQVTKAAADSTLAKIIRLVEEAQGQKAKTQRFLDRAEQYYAIGVIAATFLAVIIPVFLIGEAFNTAFYRAMTLMVAASPCALVISTPASILSGIGNGARRGILFKGGVYLEQAAGIQVVAFDKTGTLTVGKPEVSDVRLMTAAREPGETWSGDEDGLLALVATVEGASEHLLAHAAVEEAKKRKLRVSEALAFEAISGRGVRATVEGRNIVIGNRKFVSEASVANSEEALAELERLEKQNKTAVLVAEQVGAGPDPRVVVLGVVGFSDQIRPDARDALEQIKEQGVKRVVMITGDNAETARRIGDQLGVDEVYSELLPDEKLRVIEQLEAKYGPVAMIGDGVNDAPALARATIGVAMGAAGTDVALETADVVLMADELSKVAYVIALSRRTRKTLVFNLGLAGLLIGLMIVGIFTVQLPLPLAVVGHEGGTVLVSLNGLRLLLFRNRKKRAVAAAA